MSEPVVVVLVSCPREKAASLAEALVECRAAACVNILPAVQSVYRWDGQVQREEESLLIIKTAAAAVADLRREVLARHPYEVPEILALPIDAGHAPYVEWVLASTRPVK